MRILMMGVAALMIAACSPAETAPAAPVAEAAPVAPAMTEAEARAAVEAQNAKFSELFAAKDAAGLAAQLYTRDGSIVPPDAPDMTGPEAIATYWTGAMGAVATVKLTTVEAIPVGPGYITERTHVTLFGADGAALGGGKAVVLWKQEDGVWKMQWDGWNNGPTQ